VPQIPEDSIIACRALFIISRESTGESMIAISLLLTSRNAFPRSGLEGGGVTLTCGARLKSLLLEREGDLSITSKQIR